MDALWTDKVFVFSIILGVIALAMIGAIWFFGESQGRFTTQRLYFAAGVLTGAGLIFALAMGMYYWEPPANVSGSGDSPGKEIFETCTKIVPPIITLVLGYYFGSARGERPSSQPPQPPASPADTGE